MTSSIIFFENDKCLAQNILKRLQNLSMDNYYISFSNLAEAKEIEKYFVELADKIYVFYNPSKFDKEEIEFFAYDFLDSKYIISPYIYSDNGLIDCNRMFDITNNEENLTMNNSYIRKTDCPYSSTILVVSYAAIDKRETFIKNTIFPLLSENDYVIRINLMPTFKFPSEQFSVHQNNYDIHKEISVSYSKLMQELESGSVNIFDYLTMDSTGFLNPGNFNKSDSIFNYSKKAWNNLISSLTKTNKNSSPGKTGIVIIADELRDDEIKLFIDKCDTLFFLYPDKKDLNNSLYEETDLLQKVATPTTLVKKVWAA